MATKLNIPVTFIMPRAAMDSAQDQMLRGEDGIRRLTESLSNVDSEHAEAEPPKGLTIRSAAKLLRILLQSQDKSQGLGFRV